MTGATGFVGAHLVAEVLRREAGPVTALVGHDPATTTDRLARALAVLGDAVPREHVARHVHSVRVRLDAPGLGLPRAVFRNLAGRARQIWHCAALTQAFGPREQLRRVNVTGTARVLELADESGPDTAVHHLSTAFVAGGRRQGTVHEDDFSDAAGFLTPYEESKFEAERLVRDWAGRSGRHAAVFRPGLLVTDRPSPPGVPRHWQSVLAGRVEVVARQPEQLLQAAGRSGPLCDSPVTVHVPGRQDARVNLVQAPWAARAMIEAAEHHRESALRTFHVTHPHDYDVGALIHLALENAPWLDIRPDPGLDPDDTGPLARMVGSIAAHLTPHWQTIRSYDRANLRAATPHLEEPEPVTADYLRAGMSRAPAEVCP
ncbi:SDR family oxidoreductase [Streptomyces sp. NPDC002004]